MFDIPTLDTSVERVNEIFDALEQEQDWTVRLNPEDGHFQVSAVEYCTVITDLLNPLIAFCADKYSEEQSDFYLSKYFSDHALKVEGIKASLNYRLDSVDVDSEIQIYAAVEVLIKQALLSIACGILSDAEKEQAKPNQNVDEARNLRLFALFVSTIPFDIEKPSDSESCQCSVCKAKAKVMH